MSLKDTVKEIGNILTINYSTDKENEIKYELEELGYRSSSGYYLNALKKFIYNVEKPSDITYNIHQVYDNENHEDINCDLDSIKRVYLLEVKIDTLDQKPLVLYANKDFKIYQEYESLDTHVIDYITKIDILMQHSGNYYIYSDYPATRYVNDYINKDINGLLLRDEKKGDFYIDVEFNKYGGPLNQDFDYSSVTVNACLDGIKIFDIFNVIFLGATCLNTLPIKYELKLIKLDESAHTKSSGSDG